MAKKKIKAGKTTKKAQENKYFIGALLTIAGLLVVGIAAVVIFGGAGTPQPAATNLTGHDAMIFDEMESAHGDAWRADGLTDWEYAPDLTKFYVDLTKWGNYSIDEQKKEMNKAGKTMGKLIKKHGKDPKQLYVMFHDSVNRDMMIGTYSGATGAAIQQ